jgi:drug/metabolite transporter (DMT)-like permease
MDMRIVTPHLALTVAAACWGSNPVVARLVIGEVPPLFLSWTRWFLALCFLAPLVWSERRQIAHAIRRSWGVLLTLSLLANVPQSALVYKGLETTTAVNVGLLNSTIPLLIILAGAAFFSRSMVRQELFGILISFAGVLFLLFQGSWEKALSLSLNRGDLFAFGAMVTWAFYTLLLPRRPPELSLLAFVAAMSILGCASTFPAVVAELALVRTPSCDLQTLGALIYIALLPTLAGTLLYSYGAERLGPVRAGVFIHVMPVFATLFAVLLLPDRLRYFHVLGFLLIAGGALFALSRATRT